MHPPYTLWIIVTLALGWLLDYFFWDKPWGISFPLFVGIVLAAGIALLHLDRQRLHPRSLALLPVIAFFAVFSMFRLEPMSRFLALALTLAIMVLLAVSAAGGRWPFYRLADYIIKPLGLILSTIVGGGTLIGETRLARRLDPALPGGNRLGPYVRGALLALPVLALFLALLASADLIFAQRLGDVVERFRLERLTEYALRLALICAAAYGLAGIFLHAARKSSDENVSTDATSPSTGPLGIVEAGIILGSVCALFAVFVAFQFQYFFSGLSNIHLEGFTYAEYARRGFGELVVVAFFSLLLFLGLGAFTRRQILAHRRIFAVLGGILTALVGLILVSAFQRLLLYESVYGYSRLRTYPHVFIVWLGLLLLAAALLEAAGKSRRFMLALVLAALGFAATLNLINVDGMIARRNVERHALGYELDVPYLATLSYDAVPDLAQQYRRLDLPPEVHDAVGAALVCLRDRYAPPTPGPTAGEDGAVIAEAASEAAPGAAWQSFHASRRLGELELAALSEQLDAYTLDREVPGYGRLPTVITPLGASYACGESWD